MEARVGGGQGPSARRLAAVIGLGWVLGLWAGPAPASDTSGVDPIATFSATALVSDRELASATAAVTVIDRQQILESGAATVGELLRQVAGVYVTSTTRGGSTTAQLRGGDPNFTFVLLDGVPLNDPTGRQGGSYNLEALSVASIERIEVVRGPLSTFFGSSGLGGGINIVTRTGEVAAAAERTDFTLEAGLGEGSQRLIAASVGGGAGNSASYFVGLSSQRQSRLIAEEEFEETDLVANLHLKLGDRAGLDIQGRYADWQGSDYPESSGGPVLGSGELRQSDNTEATLGIRFQIQDRGGRQHRLRGSLHQRRLDRTSPAIFPLVPPSVETTRYTRSRLAWAVRLPPRPRTRFTPRFTLGAELEHERGRAEGVLLLPPFLGGDLPSDYRIERTTPGLFAEMVTHWARFDFEVGVRVDLPEDQSAEVSPRLALSTQLGEGSRRLRASLARSFKLPSFFALASPPQLGGNPDLRPETVVGADLAVIQPFATGELTAGIFWSRYRDLVDFDFDLFTHLNRSRVRARGAEVEIAWQPAAPWNLRAQLTYREVEDLDSGEELRNRPRLSGNAQLSYQATTRLRWQAQLQSVSSRLDQQIAVPTRSSVEGYQLLTLGGTWRVTPRWEFRGQLDNATDRGYETLIGFPGAGRSLHFSLRLRATGDLESAPD